MGLFRYKRYVHPVRTARRAAVRTVTPKPVRKVRRAAITAAHPASSLEGATKAAVSRSVKTRKPRGPKAKQQSGNGTLFAGAIAAVLCFGPSVALWDEHVWWGYVAAVVVGIPLYPLGAVVVISVVANAVRSR